MRKIIVSVIIVITVVFTTGCVPSRNADSVFFIGEIVEIYNDHCLVEVVDKGTSLYKNIEVVVYFLQDSQGFAIGDLLVVEFSGVLLETDPPQIRKPFSISKTDNA